MPRIHSYLTKLIFTLCTLTLTSCSAPEEWDKDQNESQSGPPTVSDFNLEQRDDNLFYQTGSDTPFTGTHVVPDTAKEEQERFGFTIETPYENGQIHGTQRVYYPGGALQEERTFNQGIPERSVSFYSDGGIKTDVTLNADNEHHGPFLRFHRDGNLQIKAGFNHNKWHGEKEIFTENGELISHYVWKDGKITEIKFESEEGRADRLQHYGRIPDVDGPEDASEPENNASDD